MLASSPACTHKRTYSLPGHRARRSPPHRSHTRPNPQPHRTPAHSSLPHPRQMQPATAAFASGLVPYKRVLAVLLRPTCISLSVSNPYQSLAEPAGAVLLRVGKVPERTLSKLLSRVDTQNLTGVLWGCEHLISQEAVQSDSQTSSALQQVQGVLSRVCPSSDTPLTHAWWDKWRPDAPDSPRALPPGGPSSAPAHITQFHSQHPAPDQTNPTSQPSTSQASQPSAATATVHQATEHSAHVNASTSQGIGSSSSSSSESLRLDLTQCSTSQAGSASNVSGVSGVVSSGLSSKQSVAPGSVSVGQSTSVSAAEGAPCSKATVFLQHWLDSLGSQNTFG